MCSDESDVICNASRGGGRSKNGGGDNSNLMGIICYPDLNQSHYREVPQWEISMKTIWDLGRFWAGWQYVQKKKFGVDYEQLLRAFFSCFQGQKNIFFKKYCKSHLISKANYGLPTSSKKRTDEFDLFAFLLFTANKPNNIRSFFGRS